MSEKFDHALANYVAACLALDIELTGETLAVYAETWRRLREAAQADFGDAAFVFLTIMLDARFDRADRAAVARARTEFERRIGHNKLLMPKRASPRKPNEDAIRENSPGLAGIG